MAEEKRPLEPADRDRIKTEFDREWRRALRREAPPKERMRIPRQPMPERGGVVRGRDFGEVNLGFGAEAAQAEARRCLDCAVPGCVAGCPVVIDIPTFVKLIERGEFAAAGRSLKETNSLPAVCGRVCPQETQCEAVCNLKRASGIPVAIGHLERFAADFERAGAEGSPAPPVRFAAKGPKAAVVGSGPAGLTAAGELARMGHAVTVFEALHEPGGVLVYGIPEFRLPKAVLRAEVEALRARGVEFRLNFIVGRTATLDDLRAEGFRAFFIGTGAGLPNFMKIPGENLVGVYSANEYLTRVNLMRAHAFPAVDTPVPRARQAAVIGGGNVALDAVRTARRLGAERAMIIYRRSREEMPARVEEIKHAEEEGVEIHLLTAPIRYEGDAAGRLRSMTCLRMELGEPDDSGRRRPIPVPGSEFEAEIDLAVVAVGQSPNPLLFDCQPELRRGRWGTIEVDAGTLAAGVPGVFAGGDIVRGGATVILAMGDARRAAVGMDAYLRGEGGR
ncbi:MAG: NADPH-dependent glutamate synthase [Candidatus Aminicenantes bacterium]|nr:NADPH-dependent glutamate synthase [Candidatus Aminicenantes bacterium]